MKMILITVGCLFIMYILYVVVYFIWWSRNFYGLSYYGKLLSERRDIKRKVIQYGKVLIPFEKILSLIIGEKLITTMPQYEGMTYSPIFFPKNRIIMARSYKPQSEDIFIVRQYCIDYFRISWCGCCIIKIHPLHHLFRQSNTCSF